MNTRDLVVTLLIMTVWGVNFPIGKYAVSVVPPLLFVTLRFALVALLLVPVSPPPRGRWGALLLLSSTMGLAHFPLMFIGMRHADGAIAAIVTQIGVPFSALLAYFWFGERLSARRIAGMVVAIAGVVVLAGEPRPGTEVWAVALITVAAMVWSFGNILMKQLSGMPANTLNGWMALFATPQLLVVTWLVGDAHIEALADAGWGFWAALAFQAFIVVMLCYALWLDLLARYPINQITGFTLLVPVIGACSSLLLLGESMTWPFIAGAGATIAGVGLIVLGPRGRAKPAGNGAGS